MPTSVYYSQTIAAAGNMKGIISCVQQDFSGKKAFRPTDEVKNIMNWM